MNYHKRLETAVNDVLTIVFDDEKDFFKTQLAPRLQSLHNVLLFPSIDNNSFHEYLELFRNDLKLDINACLNLSPMSSYQEKQALLKKIESHVKAKLGVGIFAFSYYMRDKKFIFREEVVSNVYSLKPSPDEGYQSSRAYAN